MLATAFEWMRAATIARVDMTLAAALAAVLAGLVLALAGAPPRRAALGPLVAGGAAALGALAKGPVAILLPALAVGAFLVVRRNPDERVRLRPARILVIAVAGALLWYVAAALHSGPAFIDVVVRENLLRFVDTEAADTGHAHGVGYLFGVGLVGLLPWTPLLALAAAPLARRPRPPVASLAGLWIATGFVFFALASSKRSVYLLPLYPAVALLVGAGVAAGPMEGRLAATARATARLYAPVLALMAATLLALATGRDLVLDLGLARWLRPPDLDGARAAVEAARAAAAPLLLLALATLAVVPFVARAARTAAWPHLVLLVAAVTVAWTTALGAFVLPAIAEGRSLRTFLAHVGGVVVAGEPLYTRAPIDPGLRYYATPGVTRWPAGHTAGGLLLVWEDEWRRLRDSEGNPLRVITVSETRRGSRGHLALVRVPLGAIAQVTEAAQPTEPPPGLSTGR